MIKKDAVYLNRDGTPCWKGLTLYSIRVMEGEWDDIWSAGTIPKEFRILTKMVKW